MTRRRMFHGVAGRALGHAELAVLLVVLALAFVAGYGLPADNTVPAPSLADRVHAACRPGFHVADWQLGADGLAVEVWCESDRQRLGVPDGRYTVKVSRG